MPKCTCGHDEVNHTSLASICVFNDDCYRYEPAESNTEEVVDEKASRSTLLPRKEDPKLRADLLARIVASYISGIHHDDVLPDEIDIVMSGKILNYIDKMVDDSLEQR